MSFVRTLAPPCVAEEDSRDDKSDGGGEDPSMMGDVDDCGDCGVVGHASSTDWDVLRLGGNTTLPS